MSNICLKVTIEKNWYSQTLVSLSLKNLSLVVVNFLGAPTHADIKF